MPSIWAKLRKPKKGSGAAFLRIALKALADVRAILFQQETDRPGMDPELQGIKLVIGVDPDHMFVNDTLREIFL